MENHARITYLPINAVEIINLVILRIILCGNGIVCEGEAWVCCSDRPSQCLRALLVRGAEVADYYKASHI